MRSQTEVAPYFTMSGFDFPLRFIPMASLRLSMVAVLKWFKGKEGSLRCRKPVTDRNGERGWPGAGRPRGEEGGERGMGRPGRSPGG